MSQVEERARQSLGQSDSAIHEKVARLLDAHGIRSGTVLDVGCGRGLLPGSLGNRFDRYIGIDVVRHDGYPTAAEFRKVDLDSGRADLPGGSADAVISLETIEHVENPRAFFRELARLARPGGTIIVSTPNQLSVLSKLTLLLKNRFNAFQESDYPAHLTALLEIDLVRIAQETGLEKIEIAYSESGRVIFTPKRYPGFFSRAFPRAFSDNVILLARKPAT